MQKIKALIDKLNRQFEEKAHSDDMLFTIQLLQKELTGGLRETEVLGHSKVSVLIPHVPAVRFAKKVEGNDDEKIYFELSETEASDEEINELLLRQTADAMLQAEKSQEIKKSVNDSDDFDKTNADAMAEVPTYAQYIRNERNAAQQKFSEQEENMVNQQQPKQLKTFITEMDKQLFLKELFRGDADMYERSLKTIDNFQSFGDAEYWILREMKTKLGWLPESPTADHFDRIVRKRFA